MKNREIKFINRELSWLEFNKRVLEEAENIKNPILERLNFLAISGSNLDEFFMVRVAGLKGQVDSGVLIETIDGLLPEEILSEVIKKSKKLKKEQNNCWNSILIELKKKGIEIIKKESSSKLDSIWLENYFSK